MVSALAPASGYRTLRSTFPNFREPSFFCLSFSWALPRANSCARQPRVFCFSRSSQQIFLKRAEVLLCSWLRFQLFSPSDVQLALLFLPLRNCRVPACKPLRLRSPLASFAPRKSVSLKRATRSDLDAPISSLLSPVSRPCSLAVG